MTEQEAFEEFVTTKIPNASAAVKLLAADAWQARGAYEAERAKELVEAVKYYADPRNTFVDGGKMIAEAKAWDGNTLCGVAPRGLKARQAIAKYEGRK